MAYKLLSLDIYVLYCGLYTIGIFNPLSESPHSSHKHAYWKKKQNLKIIVKLRMQLEFLKKDWLGQQSLKEASNIQKLYIILLAWLWRIQIFLFHFCSVNSEGVKCICLQCNRRKQNRYGFLGKTATIDKCAVSLRVISIAYLFIQSLVNSLS